MSGGVEINFRLTKWRYDLVLGHILPISQPPPPGNNFTVPYYFIYFFNNSLTVINICKYFNIAIEYQIKLYIIHVLSVLKSKIHPVVYYYCCVLIGWATTRLYVIAHHLKRNVLLFGGKKGLKSSFHLLKSFCLYIFDQLVVFY